MTGTLPGSDISRAVATIGPQPDTLRRIRAVPRTVRVMRYVTPLREGGSLPAIVEGDDEGLYVLKFRGAGQGPLALVAELISGEIGRRLGLRIPELVFMELDEAIGRNEEDPEIRDLLLASVGLNVGIDFLPGATMFDPAAGDSCRFRNCVQSRLVRCLRHEYRPHRQERKSTLVAQAATLHRSRRKPLLPS